MKNTFTFPKYLFIVAISLASCNNMTISTGDGSNKVQGSGKVKSEARDLKPFSAIAIDGVFNVVLEQGTKEAVTVETDDNIVPLILTTVENDTLKVRMKDSTSIKKMDKLNVHITLVNIMNLSTVGVGSVKCANVLHLNELDLNFQGVGATELNLDVQKLNVKSEIVGALLLSGIAKETVINHNGIGMIKAFDLKAEKLTLRTDGVGAAEVFASDELIIDANGVGGVQYKGDAAKKQIHNNGVGKVVCEDCK